MLLAPMCAVFYETHSPERLRVREAKGGDVEFVRRLPSSLGAHSLLPGAHVRRTWCANLLHSVIVEDLTLRHTFVHIPK